MPAGDERETPGRSTRAGQVDEPLDEPPPPELVDVAPLDEAPLDEPAEVLAAELSLFVVDEPSDVEGVLEAPSFAELVLLLPLDA